MTVLKRYEQEVILIIQGKIIGDENKNFGCLH
jgi:hypothetical protein